MQNIIITTVLILGVGGSLGAPLNAEQSLGQIAKPGTIQSFMNTVNSVVGSTYALFKGVDYKYDNVYNTQLLYQILNTYYNNKQRVLEMEQENILSNDLQEDRDHFLVIAIVLGLIAVILMLMLALQLKTKISREKKRNNRRNKKNKIEEEG